MIDWLRRRLGPAAPVEADGCAVDAGSVATMQAAALAFAEGEGHFKKGSFEEAVVSLERAISCQHDLPEAHFLLGLVHEKCGRLEDAGDCLLLATTFRPDFADAWFQLGVVDLARGRAVDAERNFDAALRAAPGHVSAHMAMAGLCEQRKQFGAALEHWHAVAKNCPDHAVAYCNLGRLTLRESLDHGRALQYVRQALALAPTLAEAHSCLAQILQFQGQSRDAIAAADIALRLDPGAVHTRMIRALALLSVGEFAAGWADYEARKKVYPVYAARRLPYPEWDGSPLAGKRLLVYHEQGIGDEIMFASCLQDVLRTGAQCIVECSTRLQTLLARSFPAARFVAGDQTSPDVSHVAALPACDFQVALGSLPRFLRTAAADFAGTGAYLRADAEAATRWRNRLQEQGAGPNIGLSWRGGAQHTNQAGRSIQPDLIRPLLTAVTSHFVSLQYGEHAADLAVMAAGDGVTVSCWAEALMSLDETAALVDALDLVITVDTTVAHLAAALGKPVWVLLPSNAEWRYLTTGARMPWYSSMRLFRRTADSSWESVVAAVAVALASWCLQQQT